MDVPRYSYSTVSFGDIVILVDSQMVGTYSTYSSRLMRSGSEKIR
jgi:hypothetical protein